MVHIKMYWYLKIGGSPQYLVIFTNITLRPPKHGYSIVWVTRCKKIFLKKMPGTYFFEGRNLDPSFVTVFSLFPSNLVCWHVLSLSLSFSRLPLGLLWNIWSIAIELLTEGLQNFCPPHSWSLCYLHTYSFGLIFQSYSYTCDAFSALVYDFVW